MENPTSTPEHVCQMCKAQFSRLEHLKRHVNTLHSSSKKPNLCDLCGKSYSRPDILRRHYLSCPARTTGSLSPGTKVPHPNQTCRSCKELNTHCSRVSDQSKCVSCIDRGSNCLYESYDPPQNIQDQQTSSKLLSDNSTLERSYQSTELVAPQPSHEKENVITPQSEMTRLSDMHLLQMEAQDHFTSSEQWPSSSYDYSEMDYLDPNYSNGNDNPAMVTLPEKRCDTSSERKRGNYVSNACANCQKQKVKCTGEQICSRCLAASLQCVYIRKRRIRKRKAPKANIPPTSDNVQPVPKDKLSAVTSSEAQAVLADSLSKMADRMSNLERECYTLRHQVALAQQYRRYDSSAHTTMSDDGEHQGSDQESTHMQVDEDFVREMPALWGPIEAMNRTLASEAQQLSPPRTDPGSESPRQKRLLWQGMSQSASNDLKMLERETRAMDLSVLREAVDLFFSHFNPHYPSLNENQFRAQLEIFLNKEIGSTSSTDHQFCALINLILAEVKIVSQDWPESSKMPAWEEFRRAECILDHLKWLENGNILTVQCLLVKARYLLYTEQAEAAYNTMSRVVHICFQRGLHKQSLFDHDSPFEVVMKQRIIWTVFYLERNVAMYCGAPYLLRESDFKVDFPKNYEDKELFPDQPLPKEVTQRSYGPYLAGAVKWGQFCSEIWDQFIGASAKKPPNPEDMAAMDARIICTNDQLPGHLQWQANLHRLDGNSDTPVYVLRQTNILHLRMNQLRLVLRRENMLNMAFNDSMAKTCIAVAESSIDAIEKHRASQISDPTGRWTFGFYIVGALLPLVCIIVKKDNNPSVCSEAIELFKRGLAMLNAMAPNSGLARHALGHLQGIIVSARQAMSRFQMEHLVDNTAAEISTHNISKLSDLFDLDVPMELNEDILNPHFNDEFFHGWDAGLVGNSNYVEMCRTQSQTDTGRRNGYH